MALSSTTATFRNLVMGGRSNTWIIRQDGIDGWETKSAVREKALRTAGVGWAAAPVSKPGRTIILGGFTTITEGNRDAIVAEWDSQTGLTQDPWTTEPLTIDIAGRALTVDAQLVDARLGVGSVGWGMGRMTWALQFECNDPRRYVGLTDLMVEGAPTTAGTGITPPLTPPISIPDNPAGGALGVNNTGTAPAPCHIELWGPWTNPGVTVGAGSRFRQVTYGFTLASGDVLDLDTREGAAFLNSTYRTTSAGSDLVSDLELLPGLNTLAGTGTPGSGAKVVCRFRPAYW